MIKEFYPVFASKKHLTPFIFIIGAAIFFCSCKIYKPTFYFKDVKKDTVISGFVNNDLELKIQMNDVLAISISSLSSSEDLLFNKGVTAIAGGKTEYLVSADGNIYVHKIGKVPVIGMTRKELKSKLENDLLPYLKDPIVTVNFGNHRVTVLGETVSMIVEMPEERISLLEVMAKSNSVTINTQLSRLMVIRETKNNKEIKHLNLEDPSIFTSPWYYLQPNDIVVVKPNEEKFDDEQKRTRNQLLYGTIISGLTFLLVVIDRIFR